MLEAMRQAMQQALRQAMQVEQCTYVRNVRTNKELLTFSSYLTFSNARRGGEENRPTVGEKWPVLRTATTEKRRNNA